MFCLAEVKLNWGLMEDKASVHEFIQEVTRQAADGGC